MYDVPKSDSLSSILDAAEKLFLSQGYSQTSMRQIAEAAGFRSVAALYNHVPNKEAILVDLLRNRSRSLPILTEPSIINEPNAALTLNALYEDLCQFTASTFFWLALLDVQEFEGRHVERYLAAWSEVLNQKARFLVEQPDASTIPPDTQIRLLLVCAVGEAVVTRLFARSSLTTSRSGTTVVATPLWATPVQWTLSNYTPVTQSVSAKPGAVHSVGSVPLRLIEIIEKDMARYAALAFCHL